ncbi:MAG: chromosomal replication initiator protein DnaA [Clostridia bacterium]
MNSVLDVWKMALDVLESRLTHVTIGAWFQDITPISFIDNVLILTTPNEFKKEILEERFLSHIKEAFSDLFSTDITVIIQTTENVEVLEKKEVLEDFINNEYTFEKFIVGKSNAFAHAAAISVASNPATDYNPLLIYGPSGLGKTHLLNAISYVIKKNNNNARIVYIKGEDFTNELIHSIQTNDSESFRDKYRMADLLLIDDIQFIAGKTQTQEEFFHTFNFLHESKKQIVLTSDRPPKEIHTLEDRLKTRFEWGLLADIQPPDYETRLAIINEKSKNLGIYLEPEIANLIATSINSNVRQLEGTVKKILALHKLMNKPINLELAEIAIKDVFSESPGLKPTPKLIIEEVGNYYNITSDQIISNNRSKDMTEPRQIAMYLVRNLTEYSLPEMGKVFSRDHSTVLHSTKKVENLIKENPDVKNIIDDLTKNIQNK